MTLKELFIRVYIGFISKDNLMAFNSEEGLGHSSELFIQKAL